MKLIRIPTEDTEIYNFLKQFINCYQKSKLIKKLSVIFMMCFYLISIVIIIIAIYLKDDSIYLYLFLSIGLANIVPLLLIKYKADDLKKKLEKYIETNILKIEEILNKKITFKNNNFKIILKIKDYRKRTNYSDQLIYKAIEQLKQY